MFRVILITGTTGKQGGSVIDALLNQYADVEIVAVSRDTSSCTDSCPRRIKARSRRNLTQGKALIEAALKNNVKFFVYTSVDRGGEGLVDNPTPIPYLISKHNIEHHLIEKAKGTQMNWTILRLTAFQENFTPDFLGKVFATCGKISVRGKSLQLISVVDIGFFGAQAFVNPDEYRGKCLSLAGDELSFEEMARIFKAKTGRDIHLKFGFLARLLMWFMKALGYMFRWIYDSGYRADISALRKVRPGLKNFTSLLETESGFMDK